MANNEIYSISTIATSWGTDEITAVYILKKYQISEIAPGHYSSVDIQKKEIELEDGLDTLYDAFNHSMDDLFKTLNKNIEEIGLGNQLNIIKNEYEDLISKITRLQEKDDPELEELIRENEEFIDELKTDIEDIEASLDELDKIENESEVDHVKKDYKKTKLRKKIDEFKNNLERQDEYNRTYLLDKSNEEYIETYESQRANNIDETIETTFEQYRTPDHDDSIKNRLNYHHDTQTNESIRENITRDDVSSHHSNVADSQNKNSTDERYNISGFKTSESDRSEYDRILEESFRDYDEPESGYTKFIEHKNDNVSDSSDTGSHFAQSYRENKEYIEKEIRQSHEELATPIASGYSLNQEEKYNFYIHGSRENYDTRNPFVISDSLYRNRQNEHDSDIQQTSTQESDNYITRVGFLDKKEDESSESITVISKDVNGKYRVESDKESLSKPIDIVGTRQPVQNTSLTEREIEHQQLIDAPETSERYTFIQNDTADSKIGENTIGKFERKIPVGTNKVIPVANKEKLYESTANKESKENKKNSYPTQRSNDPKYNILVTDKLKKNVQSWGNTLVQVSGVEEAEAFRGYHKIAIGIDTATILAAPAAIAAHDLIAYKQFKKFDVNPSLKILSDRKIIKNAGTFKFDIDSAEKFNITKREFTKAVSEFCKQENIADFTKLSSKNLSRYIKSGKLSNEAKEIAELTLKFGNLKSGFEKFNLKNKSIRLVQNVIKRIASENDAVRSAFVIYGACRTLRATRKAIARTRRTVSSVTRSARNFMKANNRLNSITYARRLKNAGNISGLSRIRHNRTIYNIRQTGINIGHRLGNTKAVSKVTQAGISVGRNGMRLFRSARTFGIALKTGNVSSSLGMLRAAGLSLKTFGAQTIASGVSAIASAVAAPAVIAIATISLIICMAMCCLTCSTLMLNYTNNAFGTSNSFIKNVENIFADMNDSDSATNDKYSDEGSESDESGKVSETEDSVGWYSLKNDVKFYSIYEDVVDKTIEKYAKKNDDNEYQKTSKLNGNIALKKYIKDDANKLNFDEVVYYISTQKLISVLRDSNDESSIGSDYPYYNSQEILSMASAKLQSSIFPYSYRRYTRVLRDHSYAIDRNLVGSIKGWFSDTFAWKDNLNANNIILDDDEVYYEKEIEDDAEVVGSNFASPLETYKYFRAQGDGYDDETVYIGYRYLTKDELLALSGGKHTSPKNRSWIISKDGGYSEDNESKLIKEIKDQVKEDYNCDNCKVELVDYHTECEYKDVLDENGNPTYDAYGNPIRYEDEDTKKTIYSFKVYCLGHKTFQAYVRCATFTGTGNLYDLDDECEDDEGIFTKLKRSIFGDDGDFSWSDDTNSSATDSQKQHAIELKSEAEGMAVENWVLAYSINWEKLFEEAKVSDYYDTVGYRMSQGDGDLSKEVDEEQRTTPYGFAVNYIDRKIGEISDATVIDENTIQTINGTIYSREDVLRIQIVNKALSYVGKVKYFYGATTPQYGVSDCSAYISDVLGIKRTTTSGFVGDSSYVSLGQNYDSMKPGDLLITIGDGRGSHVRMFTGDKVKLNNDIYYITVECTSGAKTNFYSSKKVSGCSCSFYSASDLSGSGYNVYSIENHLEEGAE